MAFLSRIKIKSQIDKKKKRKLKCRLSSRRTNIINQKKEKRGKSENYEKEDKEEKRERARENTVTTIILVNKERKKEKERRKKKQHEANNNSNKDYTKPKKCDWRHSKPAVHSLFYLELFIVGASTPPAGARTPLRPWALLVQEQWSRFSLFLFVILIFVYFLTFFFV